MTSVPATIQLAWVPCSMCSDARRFYMREVDDYLHLAVLAHEDVRQIGTFKYMTRQEIMKTVLIVEIFYK